MDRVGTELMDLREDSKTQNTFFSVTYPFSFRNLKHNFNLNMNSLTNEDQLATERRNDYFYQRSDSKTISIALSSKFEIPLRTVINFSRTSIQVPVQDEENIISFNELTWTSFNSNGRYSFWGNKLKVSAGLSYLSNKGTTPISNEDILDKQVELKAEYDAKQYQRDRAVEYPSWQDQLDDIYHNGIDGWKATIKVTKDKYPK